MTTATAPERLVERTGVVTFKGKPMTLVGPEVKVGQPAPSFHVTAQDLSTVTFEPANVVRVLNVVTSLDTGICDAQTRKFHEEAAKISSAIEVWTISMDLPFAQKRWCGAAGLTNAKVYSDYRDASFGTAFGCLMKELHLLSRAVFIVDAKRTVRYAEYVPEVATHPNYDAALAALRNLER